MKTELVKTQGAVMHVLYDLFPLFLIAKCRSKTRLPSVYISEFFSHLIRTNELCQKYSEACVKLCQELDVKVVDLFTAFQRRDNWTADCFT